MIELLEDLSTSFLVLLMLVVILLGTIYLLNILWNVVRAIVDHERGFQYYFSDEGPDN